MHSQYRILSRHQANSFLTTSLTNLAKSVASSTQLKGIPPFAYQWFNHSTTQILQCLPQHHHGSCEPSLMPMLPMLQCDFWSKVFLIMSLPTWATYLFIHYAPADIMIREDVTLSITSNVILTLILYWIVFTCWGVTHQPCQNTVHCIVLAWLMGDASAYKHIECRRSVRRAFSFHHSHLFHFYQNFKHHLCPKHYYFYLAWKDFDIYLSILYLK